MIFFLKRSSRNNRMINDIMTYYMAEAAQQKQEFVTKRGFERGMLKRLFIQIIYVSDLKCY